MSKAQWIARVTAVMMAVNAMTAAISPGQNSSAVAGPPASAGGASAVIRQDKLRQLLVARGEERVALLRAWVREEYKATRNRGTVYEAVPEDSKKAIDEEGIRRLIEVLEGSVEGQASGREWLLFLVTAVYSHAESVSSQQKVIAALDGQYRAIRKMDSSDLLKKRARQVAWNGVCCALRTVGDADLLTDEFWKAMESLEWRDAGAVACLADADVLKKLKSYRGSAVWENAASRERISRLINYSTLLIANPEIKEVTPGLEPVLMDMLGRMDPKNRRAWLQREIQRRSATASKAATLPAMPTSRTSQAASGESE